MNTAHKRLLILSLDKGVNKFLCNTIHNIIGSEVTVSGACINEIAGLPEYDLIMTSGENMLPLARKSFPGRPLFAPQRIITGYNLEKVLMLPKGTTVLVVNHPRYAAEETLKSLKDLGITHLNYVPFWKGREAHIDLAAIQTAISPGMTHLCPAGIETVIDIGPRLISIKSFSELLLALNLDQEYLENYANNYHFFLMESSRKLAEALVQARLLRKRNEVILNEFDDGVISVNQYGRINLANKSAARFLGRDETKLLQSKFHEAVKDFEKVADLIEETDPEGKSAGIFNYRGKQMIVSKIPVIGAQADNYIYTFREIARIQRLEKDVRAKLTARGHVTKYDFKDIWGESEKLVDLIEMAGRFAQTERNIIITGESGTGKEIFAHAIHRNSMRREGPFVAVNFAGISESLIESELFGYVEGAFTGAKKGGKTGLFEQAHGGTIFLDEIGDASPSVQSRLLRVLQEREVMKVGGAKIVPVDVRVISATNTDLRLAMEKGRFRKDLYYRLNTLPLSIPPLRERPADILHIVGRYLDQTYKVKKTITPSAKAALTAYDWPGNIRELINTAEYAFISSRGNTTIERTHLPENLRQCLPHRQTPSIGTTPEDFGPLLARLEAAHLDRYVLCRILRILDDRAGQVTGRNTLCRTLQARQILITEGRMKTILRHLKRHGLVEVGATKQGTRLTARGKSICDFLENTLQLG
jgi:transcriptional regulator with PAS, ATPase and Fis domain